MASLFAQSVILRCTDAHLQFGFLEACSQVTEKRSEISYTVWGSVDGITAKCMKCMQYSLLIIEKTMKSHFKSSQLIDHQTMDY